MSWIFNDLLRFGETAEKWMRAPIAEKVIVQAEFEQVMNDPMAADGYQRIDFDIGDRSHVIHVITSGRVQFGIFSPPSGLSVLLDYDVEGEEVLERSEEAC